MNVVSRFEANLLRVLYFFLRRAPAEQALPLVGAGAKAPSCLGRTAANLVRDALAKGTTKRLARAGGWRRERHPRGDGVVEGRLWERTPPAELGLTFSRHTLDFLVWAVAHDPKTSKDEWKPDPAALTVGDRLLFYFAFGALREHGAHKDLRLPDHPAFARDGLCRLAFPEDFGSLKSDAPPDFAPWTSGAGSCILEALQPELAARWLDVERSKEDVSHFGRMRALGASQDVVLEAFLKAVEGANRLDLARFLLEAAAGLLTTGATTRNWVGGLASTAGQRLADRADTHRAALSFPRQVGRLKGWERRARATGYFDDGYQAAQLWLADWERYDGNTLHARAATIIRHLDPMKSNEGQP